VVVDSNVKKVQHPTGGVVGEVRVRDGDTVKAGDVVVRLDDTVTKASLAIVVKTLNGLYARAARLEAEQRGDSKLTFRRSSPSAPAIPMSRTSWSAKPSCSRCG
jgi:HlyD family secretion protein